MCKMMCPHDGDGSDYIDSGYTYYTDHDDADDCITVKVIEGTPMNIKPTKRL